MRPGIDLCHAQAAGRDPQGHGTLQRLHSAFVRSLVLKTPKHARVKNRTGAKNPWARHEQRKSGLLKKLAEAEEKHDFYTTLYRQYSINLLKLVIYARLLVTKERVGAYLRESHPDILATFQEIITNAEG
jgi:ParB family chromosome partitioning protein